MVAAGRDAGAGDRSLPADGVQGGVRGAAGKDRSDRERARAACVGARQNHIGDESGGGKW